MSSSNGCLLSGAPERHCHRARRKRIATPVVVFYSWQSDLPNAVNRGFVQKALESAAKAIRDDDSIEVEPVVERDTLNVPGSPQIADTIFEKIARADALVADVSIIANGKSKRKGRRPREGIPLVTAEGLARTQRARLAASCLAT